MIKTYEAIFNEDGEEQGVFGISLVKNPAMQGLFVMLSEQEQEAIKARKVEFKVYNEKEHVLIGLVLEPEKGIYRNEKGHEFYVKFKAPTIKSVAYNFFKQDYHKNSTIEHDKDNVIKGVTFVESWIVVDSMKDKGAHYGMNNPVGSWLVAMKVDSQEIWDNYIETGDVKGFSIDALIKLKEIKTIKNNKLEMATIIEKLKLASDTILVALNLQPKTPAELKFGEIMMEGDEVKFEYEGDVLEAGVKVFAVDPTDPASKIPVPTGTYPLADGNSMIVTEEGIVGEIKPKDAPAPADPNAAPATPPAPADVQAEDANKGIQQIQSILIKYEERFKVMDALAKDMVELKKEVLTFSEMPSAKPRTTDPSVKLNSKGKQLEMLRKAQ